MSLNNQIDKAEKVCNAIQKWKEYEATILSKRQYLERELGHELPSSSGGMTAYLKRHEELWRQWEESLQVRLQKAQGTEDDWEKADGDYQADVDVDEYETLGDD